MKKFTAILLALVLVLGLAACGAPANNTTDPTGGENEPGGFDYGHSINVISREDGSGTRGAFIELFGIEQKDAEGNKVDMTTEEADITNSTAVMMTSVAGDDFSIGYISLGSLDQSVKALQVDGVEATVANIKAGAYKIARPFNIAVAEELSDAAQDFINFIMSAEGQAVIEENGYIQIAEDAAAYEKSGATGEVVVGGSSSVTPVMEKLKEAYAAVNTDVAVTIQQSDSTTGMNNAVEGVCDIGMASRELKDSELEAGLTPTVIAMDGIAVIVSNNNPVSGIASEQVMQIYTGEMTDWAAFE